MKKQTRNLVLALVAAVGFSAVVPPSAMAQAVKMPVLRRRARWRW